MDPRELWERNTVLAEAFCASDDRVRQAQSVLDEAQAERSRTLAAFSVTVGNDGAVADLMGLNEREVRVARRTVGREDARSVAEELLIRGAQPPPPPLAPLAPLFPQEPPQTPPPPPQAQGQGHGQGQGQAPGQGHPPMHDPAADAFPVSDVQLPQPRAEMPPQPDAMPQDAQTAAAAPTVFHTPAVEESVVWSASMDSVLLWSWKSGLDLQTVAAELGLDLRALLLRVQTLANDGLLTPRTPPSDSGQSGRHRRHEDPYAALISPATTPFPVYH
ncbi:hypothetical protein ACIOGX_14555 [Streptomyces sp. NPDC088147]|uniref:hypothetical protein n=1 Tax=Streptomyces sp. NPDC088147 TaxID=3365830 RepID=UPI00380EFB58